MVIDNGSEAIIVKIVANLHLELPGAIANSISSRIVCVKASQTALYPSSRHSRRQSRRLHHTISSFSRPIRTDETITCSQVQTVKKSLVQHTLYSTT